MWTRTLRHVPVEALLQSLREGDVLQTCLSEAGMLPETGLLPEAEAGMLPETGLLPKARLLPEASVLQTRSLRSVLQAFVA